jgi:hypothetical protein
MNPDLLPAVDRAGLPGPWWLLQGLLVLTFFLHAIFMNLTLGGTWIAWLSHLGARGNAERPSGALAGRMMSVNGFGISLAITTGVAPLLFVQLLYQPLFYSGTILLGWSWFALLVLLAAGYYAVYLYKFRGAPSRGRGGGIWLGLSALAFFAIAMIHVAVHLIHVQPERWPRFAEQPWSVVADPTYWPRLAHFVLAGVAFSGLVICWWAARRAAEGEEVSLNRAIARIGWRWALGATALQILDGFVLLFVLPKPVLGGMMGGGLTRLGPLTLSILLGIGLIVVMARFADGAPRPGIVAGLLGVVLAVMALMSVTRHQVRELYLEPVASFLRAGVNPQWGNFLLFLVLLVVALGTVGYMVRLVTTQSVSARRPAADGAVDSRT